MKRIPLFTILTLVVLLAACDGLIREVDPDDVLQTEAKFVVNSYISPQDTVLAVNVGKSRPVFGDPNQIDIFKTDDVIVTLSDGAQTIRLPFSPGNGFYRASARQFPIRAGQTYTLTVVVPTGERLTARTTVPQPVPLDEVKIDSVENSNRPGLNNYYLQAFWRDTPGVKNAYRLAGNLVYFDKVITGQPPVEQLVTRVDQINFGNGALVSDLNRDGLRLSSRRQPVFISFRSTGSGQAQTLPSPIIYVLYLLNVDDNYYRYHDSAERQDNVDDNPFAEPVLVQGNIEGGLGCFGSYNRSSLSGRLR